MEIIRRNSDYALRSLAHMAKFPKGEKIFIKAMADKEDVPIFFLRKIFQNLSKAKIVDSKRGPRGGFYLVKAAEDISLKDILEAAQGRIALSDCLFEVDSCSRYKNCALKGRLSRIQKKLIRIFEGYTLSDLCADTRRRKRHLK